MQNSSSIADMKWMSRPLGSAAAEPRQRCAVMRGICGYNDQRRQLEDLIHQAVREVLLKI
jgi:hypothetical protein